MKFAFFVPFRNCLPFLEQCVGSLLSQKRSEWRAFLLDDCSDNIFSPPNDDRISIHRNESRVGGLMNLHSGIMRADLDSDEIVCIMDGDDYLTREDALDIIGNTYEEKKCLLCYGQYETECGRGHCRPYSKGEFENLRIRDFIASHLKSFRYSLYEELMRLDPKCNRYKDAFGNFFDAAWDVALMTPLLEVAGYEKTAFNPHVLYHYRQHPNNEHRENPFHQSECCRKILKGISFVQSKKNETKE